MTRVFSLLLFFMFAVSVSGGEFFIAPNGKDTDPGTKEAPFASIEKARDAIRAEKEAGKNEPWTVNFAPGTYRIEKSILFDQADSGTKDAPIIYRGVSGRTFVSGGKPLTGWKENEPGIWVAEIPRTEDRTDYFEQLFVNGSRAKRTRYPDAGFLNPAQVIQEIPIAPNQSKPNSPQSIIAKPGELDLLKDVSKDELKFAHFVIHHHWDTTRRIPLAFDAEKNLLSMQGELMKHWNPWRTSSQYYIENVRTAFDQPGEWFYDGVNGKVFYRPLEGEKIETSEFTYADPGLNQFLILKGKSPSDGAISNIRFENIIFEYADTPRRKNFMEQSGLPEEYLKDLDSPGPGQTEPAQAASWTDAVIHIEGANDIVFYGCELKHIGEYGIWIRNAEKCKIEKCALIDLGAGGVRIGGQGSTKECVLDNCIIQKGGRYHASATAVWIGNGTEDNRITHNDIGDFYYTGISAGWTWGYKGGVAFRNIIEFNRIHDLGQSAMADMGGVYTLGTSHGTRVCNNVIFNVLSYAYGGWGLYTDEGSEGILMENNLVYDTSDGSFHQHYGKHNIIRNNILAFSRPHQVAVTRVEPHLSLTFEQNIVYWNQGSAIGYRSEAARVDWGSNLWWNVSGEVDFKGKKHSDWLALGKDVGGMLADPMFIDPAKRDFRLKEGSPAEKIGFVPFDYSKAGVYGEETWIKRALGE